MRSQSPPWLAGDSWRWAVGIQGMRRDHFLVDKWPLCVQSLFVVVGLVHNVLARLAVAHNLKAWLPAPTLQRWYSFQLWVLRSTIFSLPSMSSRCFGVWPWEWPRGGKRPDTAVQPVSWMILCHGLQDLPLPPRGCSRHAPPRSSPFHVQSWWPDVRQNKGP